MDYTDGLPAFYRSLFSLFPLRINRGYDGARFDVKMQCAFIVKADGDSKTFGCSNDFHRVNDLVFDFGKVLPCGFFGRVGILYVNLEHGKKRVCLPLQETLADGSGITISELMKDV